MVSKVDIVYVTAIIVNCEPGSEATVRKMVASDDIHRYYTPAAPIVDSTECIRVINMICIFHQ